MQLNSKENLDAFDKKIILCFVPYFLPGNKAGGTTQSIINFTKQLSREFIFKIICLDRDLNDHRPYSNIKVNNWNKVGELDVLYLNKKNINFRKIFNILTKTKFDLVYINSFFDYKFSILPLLINKFFLIKKNIFVIAPRGEFSSGALSIKTKKKKLFIFFSKLTNLHKNFFWQASNELEKKDILNNFSKRLNQVIIAQDLVSMEIDDYKFKNKKDGLLKIVFLSRISPMKNLDFFLNVLSYSRLNIDLSIYGPKDDLDYYEHCRSNSKMLPKNITAHFHGNVPSNEVRYTIKQYDIFVLPTKGENFGHVIFEALSVGTPSLISDKTAWQADPNGGLQILPLEKEYWLDALEKWSKIDNNNYLNKRKAAMKYAKSFIEKNDTYNQNVKLFERALSIN